MRRHSLSPCLSQLFHGSVLWEFKIQQVKCFFITILNSENIYTYNDYLVEKSYYFLKSDRETFKYNFYIQ